ncbi:MAG: GntR family transcriptional regulator [Xanthomonadales bacterium]|nr:GntR family transcriptional regulator [Xanthomonadales bacterium]
MQAQTGPQLQPLYRQVYDALMIRIVEGDWLPSESLPSEQALADELKVSQGTVRKALDALVSEKLVERRQGKGTFVAEHTQERSLFQFFRLSRENGERVVPESTGIKVKRRAANKTESSKLGLVAKSEVIIISRTRTIDGKAAVLEKIVVSASLFPDLDKREALPNSLYCLYQRDYGINIIRVEEALKADIAKADEAVRLGLKRGSPLLHIERIAVGMDGVRAEYRVCRCDTNKLVYAVSLR